jgi:hypothetical protein
VMVNWADPIKRQQRREIFTPVTDSSFEGFEGSSCSAAILAVLPPANAEVEYRNIVSGTRYRLAPQ